MSKNYLKELDQELLRCVKCGLCRPICPVFQILERESASPRGKGAVVEALAEDTLFFTPEAGEILSKCLLCGACQEACPNQAAINERILAARAQQVQERGRSVFQKAFKAFSTQDTLRDWTFKGASVTQGLWSQSIPENSGLRLRLPFPLVNKNRRLPPLPVQNLLETLPETAIAPSEEMRVAFFSGCMITYLYPAVGQALADSLNALGVTVITPKEQVCCGVPAYFTGDRETAEVLVTKNLKSFTELNVQAIITACGTCGSGWEHHFEKILEQEIKDLPPIYDIAEFLTEYFPQTFGDAAPVEEPLLVTYHDPCHLNRGQGVKTEPRRLLQKLPGINFVEMAAADTCCGFGGSFSFNYYDLSKDINDRKVNNVLASGAQILTTGCPACIFHIEDGLARARSPVKVYHTIELFYRQWEEKIQAILEKTKTLSLIEK
jgi:glycolate oxidase iron-sulfur subunit